VIGKNIFSYILLFLVFMRVLCIYGVYSKDSTVNMTVTKLEDELENLRPVVVVYDSNSAEKPNLKGDWLNFFLLLLLYTMQGVPFGLALVMPIILQSKKNVSYKDQVNI